MSQENNAETKGKPPVDKYTEQGITVSIWENITEKGTFYDVSHERSYKDADGNWQTSKSIPSYQIQTLCKLLDMAHSSIIYRAADAKRFAA